MKKMSIIVIFFWGLTSYSTLAQGQNLDSLLLEAHNIAHKGHWTEARTMVRELLRLRPNDLDAKLLLGLTYSWEQRYDSARIVFDALIAEAPLRQDFRQAANNNERWATAKREALRNPNYGDYITFEQYLDARPRPSTRMVSTLGMNKSIRRSSYAVRVNAGETLPLARTAWQAEAETYQRLGAGNYLYADFAHCFSGTFFPDNRAALEIFQSFGQNFESSLGGRGYFSQNSRNAWIITASAAYLDGKNYLALRAFLNVTDPASKTFNLTFRRYIGSRTGQFAYAVIGFGAQSNELMQLDELYNDTFIAMLGIQQYISRRWMITAAAGYTSDELGSRAIASVGARFYFDMLKR